MIAFLSTRNTNGEFPSPTTVITRVPQWLMRIFCSLLCVSLTSLCYSDDGWTSLFDGKTTAGWVQMNGTVTYAVEDGAIIGTSLKGKSPMSFLCTEKQYTDFELEFDVNVFDRALNSGVQIRSLPKVSKKEGVKYGPIAGPQVEISAGKKPGRTRSGFIYGQGWKGWLTAKEDLINHNLYKFGEWNHFRVVAKGDNVITFINGTQVTDTTIPAERQKTHSKGHIGLQVHGVKNALSPYRVAWKNIRIKEF